jgi:hypothetical protein
MVSHDKIAQTHGYMDNASCGMVQPEAGDI